MPSPSAQWPRFSVICNEAKVLKIERRGRRNLYVINPDVGLRHEVEAHRTVADILRLANTKFDRR